MLVVVLSKIFLVVINFVLSVVADIESFAAGIFVNVSVIGSILTVQEEPQQDF